MHHFFVDSSNIYEGKIFVAGSDVHHIKQVLRLPLGEMVEVSDGTGKRYQGEIIEYQEGNTLSEGIILSIVSERVGVGELPAGITLFQGLPKGDKMELIIQKAVELGVYEIVPVATKRAVVKLDEKKADKKKERWNAIAESAAKQSKRDLIPVVKPVTSYADALIQAKESDVILLPYELETGIQETKETISKIEKGQSIAIFIGPEGGFTPAEVAQGIEQGAVPITLGRRILRTETAGLTLLSILMFHLEE